jgi:hypothetical protein
LPRPAAVPASHAASVARSTAISYASPITDSAAISYTSPIADSAAVSNSTTIANSIAPGLAVAVEALCPAPGISSGASKFLRCLPVSIRHGLAV